MQRTSRISNVGMCGRKSLPTKKQIKMKSSTIRSKSISMGGLGTLNSYSKYSRRVQIFRNCRYCKHQVRKNNKKGESYNSPTADIAKTNMTLEHIKHFLQHLIRFFCNWNIFTLLIKFPRFSFCSSLAICSQMAHPSTQKTLVLLSRCENNLTDTRKKISISCL